MGMQPIAAILIREISDSSLQGARADDPVSRERTRGASKPRRSRRRTGSRRALGGLLASRG
jgi:hypothetical protein